MQIVGKHALPGFLALVLMLLLMPVAAPALLFGGESRGVFEEPDDLAYETERFHVIATGVPQKQMEYYANVCEEALKRLAPTFDLVNHEGGKILVRVCATPQKFEEVSGQKPEKTMAVAFPFSGEMALNGEPLLRAGPEERFKTVGHEMVHLLLGRLAARRAMVPFWLHEGLAQALTGRMDYTQSLRLSWANLRNERLPMTNLITEFPYSKSNSLLAYAQSLSFTEFIIREHYHRTSPEVFFREMVAQPDKARAIFIFLSHAENVADLEKGWVRSRSKTRDWWTLISSSSVIWGFVLILAFIAWRRRRRHEKAVMEEWEPWEREDY